MKVLPPLFLTFELRSSEKILHSIKPSDIQKDLYSITMMVRDMSRLKNSALSVEQWEKHIYCWKANLLGYYPIQVERHTSLNCSHGVVSTESLDDMSGEKTSLVNHFFSELFSCCSFWWDVFQLWPPTCLLFIPEMVYESGALVEWEGILKHFEKNLSQCHVIHHKTHMDLIWAQTWASAVSCHLLTTWTMAWPPFILSVEVLTLLSTIYIDNQV